MGTVAARAPDMVSFAAGYPDPTSFPWDAFRELAAELLREGHLAGRGDGRRGRHRLRREPLPFDTFDHAITPVTLAVWSLAARPSP